MRKFNKNLTLNNRIDKKKNQKIYIKKKYQKTPTPTLLLMFSQYVKLVIKVMNSTWLIFYFILFYDKNYKKWFVINLIIIKNKIFILTNKNKK
jgi:hypothetical protein